MNIREAVKDKKRIVLLRLCTMKQAGLILER